MFWSISFNWRNKLLLKLQACGLDKTVFLKLLVIEWNFNLKIIQTTAAIDIVFFFFFF